MIFIGLFQPIVREARGDYRAYASVKCRGVCSSADDARRQMRAHWLRVHPSEAHVMERAVRGPLGSVVISDAATVEEMLAQMPEEQRPAMREWLDASTELPAPEEGAVA